MDPRIPLGFSPGEIAGGLATVIGTGSGLFLLFGPVVRYESHSTDGTRETGTISGIDYLLGVDQSSPALFYWAMFVITMSIVGGYGVLAGNRPLVWIVALVLLGLSALGMMTIGLYIAPAAALFLLAAVIRRYAGNDGGN